MAEMIVSIVLDQLSSITHKLQQMNGARLVVGSVDNEVQKLEKTFQAIGAMLGDAVKSQVKEEGVKSWLSKHKDTSYAIEDALDEWNTAIQKLLTKEADHKTSKVRSFICHMPIVLPLFMGSKLKNLSKRLHTIVSTVEIQRGIMSRSSPSSVFTIDPVGFHGRDEEKKRILNMLLSESESSKRTRPTLPVISIEGFGGIGKTALARQVFEDSDVKANFKKRIWVSASYPRDEFRAAKAILESLRSSVSSLVEMETVLHYISEFVRGKKFLLVLDDVWWKWNECPYWEQLMYSLKSGSEGSRILVTATATTGEKDKNIVDKIGTIDMDISLERLPEKDCWSLFCGVALYGRSNDECQNLEHVGRQIVGKCKGLPFSVKIIGSLLRFKTSIEEWKRVLESKVWELDQEEKYFRLLLLSYYDLSPALKICFLYCSIFPRNYEIETDRLIKLWMAQGYLTVEGRGDMELIGEEYFGNLASRSLFQDFQRNEFDGRIIRSQMHPIVHDFLQFLAENEGFNLEVKKETKGSNLEVKKETEGSNLEVKSSDQKSKLESSHEKIQHLMITFESEDAFPISVYNQKKLRSLVVEDGGGFMNGIVLSEVFDQLTCLRTLDLSNHDNVWCKVIKEVPRGIKGLIHLRYLNLSKNQKIKELPKTLCELYNLQTLELSWCSNLRKLPKGMGKLINLRHVVNVGTSLSYIPKGIERWTCLRTLSEFIVSGESDGSKACKLGSLKSLNHLQGSFSVKMLGNIVKKEEIYEAELCEKKNLLALYINFEKDEEKEIKNKDDDDDDEGVLEGLEFPPNLESLEMSYYRSTSISLTRIMSLTNLRLMRLDHCMNLKKLPRLGELPALESLTIQNMKMIEKVGNEFLGTDQSSSTGNQFATFPKLKSLVFHKMKVWKEWNYKMRSGQSDKIMPHLHSLTIGYCNELEMLPDNSFLPNLEELKIISCSKLEKRYKKGTEEGKKFPQIKFSQD